MGPTPTAQFLEIAGVSGIVVTLVLVVGTLKKTGLLAFFTYHPICMSVAFLCVFARGIQTSWKGRDTDGNARVAILQSHMTTQLAGLAAAVLGFVVIYFNKYIHGKDHFTSLHGKLGLLAMLLTSVVTVLGYCGFKKYSPLPIHLHASIKWAHRGLGAASWAVALVTILVVLPHEAVVTGLMARVVQMGVIVVGVLTMLVLREKGSQGGKGGNIVDFTLVPRERSH